MTHVLPLVPAPDPFATYVRFSGFPYLLFLDSSAQGALSRYSFLAADHHPDLAVSWGKVQVKLWTHSAGGVTPSDMELAKLIEQTALWRPPSGSALRGTTKKFVGS